MKKIIKKGWMPGVAALCAAVFLMAGNWVLGAEIPTGIQEVTGKEIEQEELAEAALQEEPSVPSETPIQGGLSVWSEGTAQGETPVQSEGTVQGGFSMQSQDTGQGELPVWSEDTVQGEAPIPAEDAGQGELSVQTDSAVQPDTLEEGPEGMETLSEEETEVQKEEKSPENDTEDTAQDEQEIPVLFLENTALWKEEAAYQGVLSIRAGGWGREEHVVLEGTLSRYWQADTEFLEKDISLEEIVVENPEGENLTLQKLTFPIGEEEQYSSLAEFTVPILLRREYRETDEDIEYPLYETGENLLSDAEGLHLIWTDSCGEEQVVKAENPKLPVSAGKVAFTVEKQADRTSARPGDTIFYTITISNTGERTLHSVLSTERFLDAGVQAAFLPQEGVTLNGDGTQALVPKLEPGEKISLSAQVTLPEYFRKTELINQVIVVTDETGPMEEQMSQSSVTLELPLGETPTVTETPIPTPIPVYTPYPTSPAYAYTTPTPVIYQGKASGTAYGKGGAQTATSPKTGDDTPAAGYLFLLFLSAAALEKARRLLLSRRK